MAALLRDPCSLERRCPVCREGFAHARARLPECCGPGITRLSRITLNDIDKARASLSEVKGVSAIKHIWLRMSYRCCGMEWTDEWPAALKLECPECGEMVEAYDVAELRHGDS